jgi:soluble lytic murein transglycosylase-like protein
VSAPRSTLYLLGVLGLAGAALFLIRYRKGGQETVVDLVEDLVVSVRRAGASLAALGDWTRNIPDQLRDLFSSEGAANGMPAGLLEAVAWRESRFLPEVIDGSRTSSAGAVGIMQVVPRWHPALGEAGARDPARAIPYAADYLRKLERQFGSWRLALAAYNWGPGNLSKWQDDYEVGAWPAETRTYVEEITRNAGIA